jgi:hypothetical protein
VIFCDFLINLRGSTSSVLVRYEDFHSNFESEERRKRSAALDPWTCQCTYYLARSTWQPTSKTNVKLHYKLCLLLVQGLGLCGELPYM